MPQSMQDVGTRETHLNELLDKWNLALEILLMTSEKSRTFRQQGAIEDLQSGIEILKKDMVIMPGNPDTKIYKMQINELENKS